MKKTFRVLTMTAAMATSALLVAAGCGTVRAGYESAPFKVVRVEGKFEVRDYPALTVVETPMKSEHSGADGSFSRLFRYISGGNEARQKIAMTTPVFMSANETNGTMAFVMPAKMNTGEVPKPSDGTVRVRQMAAGRFAVLRFSGGHTAANEAQSLERLRNWMKSARLKEISAPAYGYFDPPWTPAFLRRNEVMIRTETSGA